MPTLDLTPTGLAAQARELMEATMMFVAVQKAPYDPREVLRVLPEAITAALSAVCDAARAEAGAKCPTHNRALTHCFYCVSAAEIEGKEAGRAERAEEVRQLREALVLMSAHIAKALVTARYVAESGHALPLDKVRVVRDLETALAATTEPSHG